MVFLGDKAQVKAHFNPFGDSANLDTRLVHVLRQFTTGSKLVWTHMMELLGVVGHVKSRFGLSRDSVSVGAR
jgi:hypothetical protein